MTLSLTQADRRWASDLVHQKRAESNYMRTANVPPRDHVYDDGTTHLGLPADRLKYRDLSNDELGANAIDRRTVINNAIGKDQADSEFLDAKHFKGSSPARLPEGVKIRGGSDIDGTVDAVNLPNIGGLNGDLPQDKLPNIPDNKIPKLGKTKLPNDTVYGNAQGKLSYGDLSDRPNLSRFATDAAVRGRTTSSQVRSIVRSMVKTTALK